jgi:hypothetical protein
MLAHNADIIIIPKPDISYLSMKTLIEVHREGNYFVAIDLVTNVADQGLTEQGSSQELKKKVSKNIPIS